MGAKCCHILRRYAFGADYICTHSECRCIHEWHFETIRKNGCCCGHVVEVHRDRTLKTKAEYKHNYKYTTRREIKQLTTHPAESWHCSTCGHACHRGRAYNYTTDAVWNAYYPFQNRMTCYQCTCFHCQNPGQECADDYVYVTDEELVSSELVKPSYSYDHRCQCRLCIRHEEARNLLRK